MLTDNWIEYTIDLDLSYFLDASYQAFETQDIKYTGNNDLNTFTKVIKEKSYLNEYTNKLLNCSLEWSYDYFIARHPVGLHHDYDTVYFNNSHTNTVDACRIEVGIFIPLFLHASKDFYTIFYNEVSTDPHKLIFKQGFMRYKKDNKIYEYRNKNIVDAELYKYHPKDTNFLQQGMFNDLKVHSAYKWKIGNACVFNPARWHSSNWFLEDKIMENDMSSYKISLIGFGSVCECYYR